MRSYAVAQESADAPGPRQGDNPLSAQVGLPRVGVPPPSVILEQAGWEPPSGSGPMDFLVAPIMYMIVAFLAHLDTFFGVNSPFPYLLLQ